MRLEVASGRMFQINLKRRLSWLGVLRKSKITIPILLLLVFLSFIPIGLRKYHLTAIRDPGEPFNVEEFVAYSVPESENACSLYDMHGNVWEWCQDFYGEAGWGASRGDYCSDDSVIDPQGPSKGSGRVYRGGSWNYESDYCRSAYRSKYAPIERPDLGFRVLRSSVK